MSDPSQTESSPPGQRCDVCGAKDLDDVWWVQRRHWVGGSWEPSGFAICCSPLCLFAVACNPVDYLTELAVDGGTA